MKLPYINFFVRDWLGERSLRLCSYAARGLWIDMICLMADSDKYGYLQHNGAALTIDEIEALTIGVKGTVKPLMDELEKHGVLTRDSDGSVFCRRMVKDHQNRIKSQKNGRKGGNPKLLNPLKDISNTITNTNTRERLTEGVNPSVDCVSASYGEFKNVNLTDIEYQKLLQKHGKNKLDKGIEVLGDYMKRKGKRYASHYAALKETSWVWENLGFTANKKPQGDCI